MTNNKGTTKQSKLNIIPLGEKEDSIAMQCKTTKCCNMDSFLYYSKPLHNKETQFSKNLRSYSSGPSFHFKKQVIIKEEERKKEFIPPRTNESAKSLLNFIPKPHDSCPFSASTHNHLASLQSYYSSTREYLLKEINNKLSPLPEHGLNFIKRNNNKFDTVKAYNCTQKPQGYIPLTHTPLSNQSDVNQSPMTYMRIAQFNYAKYYQLYYRKMREYIAVNKLSQSSLGQNAETTSLSNSSTAVEESKLPNASPSMTMFGKNGWVCAHCNNFNFDSKNELLINMYDPS